MGEDIMDMVFGRSLSRPAEEVMRLLRMLCSGIIQEVMRLFKGRFTASGASSFSAEAQESSDLGRLSCAQLRTPNPRLLIH